ncbi:MAG: LysR family transcriptional regulator [Firmicutes bacterium]|nr:LysR family transcriptional regulator [Bacillota bacterium]
MFSLNCKIWLEIGGQKVFGDGPCDILKRIKNSGSLRMAAKEINMSYSQAWQLMKNLEKKLGFPLLIKKVGGEFGGGSSLTPEGEKLVKQFEQFREEADGMLNELFKKYFGNAT